MPPWISSALADLVMLIHAAFVVFVALGALLAFRWPRVAWVQVPCALYGAAIELVGWVCPLTPLERRLRTAAGAEGYGGGFIEHYVGGLLYPANWTRIHVFLGVAVLVVNGAVYGWLLWRRARRRGDAEGKAAG